MAALRRARPLGVLALAAMVLLAGCAAGGGPPAPGAAQKEKVAAGSAFATIPYNTAGFLAPNQSGPSPGFGNNHDLDSAGAPGPGVYSVSLGGLQVSFRFPDVAGTPPPRDVLDIPHGRSATMTVAPGHYRAFYFLASVAGGPQPANVVLTYQDGTKQTVAAAFDDWCTVEVGHTPVPGTYAAWQGAVRIGERTGATNPVGGLPEKGCGLYVTSVNVDPARLLTSVAVVNTLAAVPASLGYYLQQVKSGARINVVAATASVAAPPPLPAVPALILPAQQPVALAPTASALCAKGPGGALQSAVPTGTVKQGLPLGQFRVTASGGDGPWLAVVHQNRYSVYGFGYNPPTESGYIYLSTDGGVPPGTRNVLLCVEYYDAAKTTSAKTGDWLGVQYSGTDTRGPVHGAYDSAPEVYATTGTGRWLTASFTLTGINFARGDPGAARENGGADMRVYYNSPTYFDRFWLVTGGVPPAQALAAFDTASLGAFIQKYS